MKVIVLGCGLVGREIVRDLAFEGQAIAQKRDLKDRDSTREGTLDESLTVTVVARDEERLARLADEFDVETIARDLSVAGATSEVIAGQDLVVGAVPGWLGLQVLREVVEAGLPVANISFMPEDPFVTLDELAKSKGVPVIVDCGVAPGTSNLLVGRASSKLDVVVDVSIMVGGLPVVRRLPYEYAALFSPSDVIEEYTRPAVTVVNGEEIEVPAMDDLELVEFPGLGTLEAFVTDGLRTLRKTIRAQNMEEKTLRYPGHREKIRLLIETGLLDEEPISINGVEVRPRDVTAHLLTQAWQMGEGEEDLTVMSITVSGYKDGKEVTHVYQLVDVFDAENGVTSVARTTGYACTAAVKLLLSENFKLEGVLPLELIGQRPELYDVIVSHLRERGIVIGETVD